MLILLYIYLNVHIIVSLQDEKTKEAKKFKSDLSVNDSTLIYFFVVCVSSVRGFCFNTERSAVSVSVFCLLFHTIEHLSPARAFLFSSD